MKQYDPRVTRFAALTAIVLAFSGTLNAALNAIPKAALGGVMLLVCYQIIILGLRIFQQQGLPKSQDYFIALSIITVGMGPFEFEIMGSALSGIGLGAITGLFLVILMGTLGLKTNKGSQKIHSVTRG